MSSLWGELKRRNVVRVAVAYAVVSWLILQLTDVLIPILGLPEWVGKLVLLLLLISFPIALFFAWAFELTPEGVKLEKHVDRSESITAQTSRKLDFIIIAVLVVAVGLLLSDRFLHEDPAQPQAIVEAPLAEPLSASNGKGNRLSVAVLPFANRSNSEDHVFFVDGIHDDILTQLAKISSLRIISRTSMMQYRDTEKSIRVIGEELDVGTILEGSVQRAGDRVRINVQLIDAISDEHIWAEVYDRALTAANIFEIQTEIATAIAGELRANLTPEEEQRLALRPTENLEAYEAYLLGRQSMARRTTDTINAAKSYFERAIDLDNNFALAYVGISDTIQLQVDYSGAAPMDVAHEAKPYVDRALELDSKSGEAYISLASTYEYMREFDAANEAYQRGLELAPNYAQGHMWYGLFLMYVRGQLKAALTQFQLAAVHDPLSAINHSNMGKALEFLGRFDESWAILQKVRDIDPTYAFGHFFIGAKFWAVDGRLDTAIDSLFTAMFLDPRDPMTPAEIARLYSSLGDDRTATCWANNAVEISPDAGWTLNILAGLSALQGDTADAAEYGRRALSLLHYPRDWTLALSVAKDHLLQNDDYKIAQLLYETKFDEFAIDEIPITHPNFEAAVDYADVLLHTGETDRANEILDAVEAYIANVPRLGFYGFSLTDVRIHTLRGDTALALATLREAVDQNWRYQWRYYLEVDSILEPLRSDPEFDAILAIIQQDMATQLEAVRAKETIEKSCSV